MYILGPNTPEQGAMPSHIVFHTVWQDLAIGIEEVTDHGIIITEQRAGVLRSQNYPTLSRGEGLQPKVRPAALFLMTPMTPRNHC